MDAEELRRAQAAADAAYEPFASFSEWASEPVALGSWDDAAAHLASVRAAASVVEVTTRLEEVLRGAAVDTGAIEGLYSADRGFTRSVARNKISLDQAEVEAGLGFRRSFEAQLAGFELALQLAIGDEVVTEAAIREIHRVTCADDSTYRVLTEHGVQERDLVLGSYKDEPNHVELADETMHAFAPVDLVPDEMHRLVEEMRSEGFSAAHPVVQAAFVHFAFVSVHPFADGNGRVARLLASIPLLRAVSIPLWVEVSDRPRYIDALESADRDDRQPFLRFMTSTTLSLLRELTVTLPTPSPPGPVNDETDAARRVVAVLEDAIGAAEDLWTSGSVYFEASPPDGLVTGPGMSLVVGILNNPGVERLVLAGVDLDGDEWSRVVALEYPTSGVHGKPSATHLFEVAELVPNLQPAARRRLTVLARGLVESLRAQVS